MNMNRVSISLAESLIRSIRILARSGAANFRRFLHDPLYQAGWSTKYGGKTSKRMMKALEHRSEHSDTIAPMCKKIIAVSMNEGLAPLGDACIFFLQRIIEYPKVASAPESRQFVQITEPPLKKFMRSYQRLSEKKFHTSLEHTTADRMKSDLIPVVLGRYRQKVEFHEKAATLFRAIRASFERGDIERCRKLIKSYIVRYFDKGDENRNEIEKLIDAFDRRMPGFRQDIEAGIAGEIYYQIIRSIAGGELPITIEHIRRYVGIFEGNPRIPYYREIDQLEQKLYEIIRRKNLWEELKKN